MNTVEMKAVESDRHRAADPLHAIAPRAAVGQEPQADLAIARSESVATHTPRHTPRLPRPAAGTGLGYETGQNPRLVGRGVTWVRPSELIGIAGSRLVGRGIDFQAELARRTRRPAAHAVAASRRAVNARVRTLSRNVVFMHDPRSSAATASREIGLR